MGRCSSLGHDLQVIVRHRETGLKHRLQKALSINRSPGSILSVFLFLQSQKIWICYRNTFPPILVLCWSNIPPSALASNVSSVLLETSDLIYIKATRTSGKIILGLPSYTLYKLSHTPSETPLIVPQGGNGMPRTLIFSILKWPLWGNLPLLLRVHNGQCPF